MEFEVKVLDINPVQMRKQLIKLGCKKLHGPQRMKRTMFSLCDPTTNGFVRVRDEGHRVTITCKLYKNKDFPTEFEVTVKEDYESACKLIEGLGLIKTSEHETMRERWSHSLAHEITIDNIPGIPTYMEIDCENKTNLDTLIKRMNIDKDKMKTGGYDKQFEEYYGIDKKTFLKIPEITFRNIQNQIKPKKNHELLAQIVKGYLRNIPEGTRESNKKTHKKNRRRAVSKGTRKRK
jgi:adenylate cyclase class 2